MNNPTIEVLKPFIKVEYLDPATRKLKSINEIMHSKGALIQDTEVPLQTIKGSEGTPISLPLEQSLLLLVKRGVIRILPKDELKKSSKPEKPTKPKTGWYSEGKIAKEKEEHRTENPD